MIIDYDDIIRLLELVAVGLCGFSLGGLSNCNNKMIRSVAWFLPGVIIGIVITAVTVAFITIN